MATTTTVLTVWAGGLYTLWRVLDPMRRSGVRWRWRVLQGIPIAIGVPAVVGYYSQDWRDIIAFGSIFAAGTISSYVAHLKRESRR
jgi:hypothetical protein